MTRDELIEADACRLAWIRAEAMPGSDTAFLLMFIGRLRPELEEARLRAESK